MSNLWIRSVYAITIRSKQHKYSAYSDDQIGVAARIAWTGAGECLPLSSLSVLRLRDAIKQVLTENSYKQNALRLQEAIRRAGRVCHAVDIIEQVVSTGKPVMS